MFGPILNVIHITKGSILYSDSD